MTVYRNFRFHSARFLPNLSNDHICKQMHGHTFNLTIYVEDEINNITGFVMDFYDIAELKNPTSENLCKWIWKKLKKSLPMLTKIKLSEDHGTGIIFTGE